MFDFTGNPTACGQLSEGARSRKLLCRHTGASHSRVRVVNALLVQVAAFVVSPSGPNLAFFREFLAP